MNAEPIPDEVEVKLEATNADALDSIGRLRHLGAYRLRRRPTQQLYTLYLDTPTRALARAGVALRVRRAGRRWEATAKWPGRVAGALHERPELTVALPGPPTMPFALPDGPLRDQLKAFVLRRPLQPLLVTEVKRRRLELWPAEPGGGAGPLAELALDSVLVRGTDDAPAVETYWEVEIERRAGATGDCLAAARELQSRFGLVPSARTKFARGLAALYGESVIDQTSSATIVATDTLAVATRKSIAWQLARVRASDPGTRLGRDAEALHEMRVAIRRLRAALQLGGRALPVPQREALARELRWLRGELGRVRDLDVQRTMFADYVRHLDRAHVRQLDGYRRFLLRERSAARAALLATLASRRYERLLLALERVAALPTRPVRGHAAVPVSLRARRVLKKAAARLLASGEAVSELADAPTLHTLRIRTKRLRYILEAVAPITGRQTRRVLKSLVALQDVLGSFNDCMVTVETVRRYRDGHTATPAAVRAALDAFADAALRRAGGAQARFAHAWKQFANKPARRQRRKILATLADAARAAQTPSRAAEMR